MKVNFLCENCLSTLDNLINQKKKVNVVLTSPPYNSRRNVKNERGRNNFECFYDEYDDSMSDEDYNNFIMKIFFKLDKVLADNGVILWNCNYGNENINQPWQSLSYIFLLTNFRISEVIYWKKLCAIPNNVSRNKLTRIIEPIFVFVRESQHKTYQMNKEIASINEKTKQRFYKNYFNLIEAPNNDGSCKLNKATFSSELVRQLLNLYAKDGDVVYDPFMGTGTTAIGCFLSDIKIKQVIGSEISKKQVEFSEKRVLKYLSNYK